MHLSCGFQVQERWVGGASGCAQRSTQLLRLLACANARLPPIVGQMAVAGVGWDLLSIAPLLDAEAPYENARSTPSRLQF